MNLDSNQHALLPFNDPDVSFEELNRVHTGGAYALFARLRARDIQKWSVDERNKFLRDARAYIETRKAFFSSVLNGPVQISEMNDVEYEALCERLKDTHALSATNFRDLHEDEREFYPIFVAQSFRRQLYATDYGPAPHIKVQASIIRLFRDIPQAEFWGPIFLQFNWSFMKLMFGAFELRWSDSSWYSPEWNMLTGRLYAIYALESYDDLSHFNTFWYRHMYYETIAAEFMCRDPHGYGQMLWSLLTEHFPEYKDVQAQMVVSSMSYDAQISDLEFAYEIMGKPGLRCRNGHNATTGWGREYEYDLKERFYKMSGETAEWLYVRFGVDARTWTHGSMYMSMCIFEHRFGRPSLFDAAPLVSGTFRLRDGRRGRAYDNVDARVVQMLTGTQASAQTGLRAALGNPAFALFLKRKRETEEEQ